MAGFGTIGGALFLGCLAASPLALLLFRPRVMGGGLLGNAHRMLSEYWPHYLLFFVVYLQKNFVDDLNHPVRGVFGDFTALIHNIEGDLVYHVQVMFSNPVFTDILSFNYLFAYIFIIYFSVILASYADDRELANKFALNYVVLYLLAIPFYVFFNVQIVSDYLPGMKALLYHSGPAYFTFFTANDPLDNAFPSLHIALPWALFLSAWWTVRKRGQTLRTSRYRAYLWFLGVQIVVFAFSIMYLGIHWATDIPGGLLIGILSATIVDELHGDFFRRYRAATDWMEGRLKWLAFQTRGAVVHVVGSVLR